MNKTVIMLRNGTSNVDVRLRKEAIVLLEQGFDVIMLGWNRQPKVEQNEFVDKIGNKEVKVYLFDKPISGRLGVRGLLKLQSFQRWLGKMLKRLRDEYQIIHACDFDTGNVAQKVAKKYNKKLVYDIYDYYSETRKLPKPIKAILKKKETNIINKADLTIICSQARIKQIYPANPKELIVIHNSPKIDAVDDFSMHMQGDGSGKIKLGYTGQLGEGRLLNQIFEVVSDYDDIEVHIAGGGDLKNVAESTAQNSPNMFFYGFRSHEECLGLSACCDILFAVYDPSVPNHKYSAPNKVYEAMAFGLPVIVCQNTGIDELVVNEDIGRAIPYDAKSFFEVAKELASDSTTLEKIKRNGENAYNQKYGWDIMAKTLANAYAKMI